MGTLCGYIMKSRCSNGQAHHEVKMFQWAHYEIKLLQWAHYKMFKLVPTEIKSNKNKIQVTVLRPNGQNENTFPQYLRIIILGLAHK